MLSMFMSLLAASNMLNASIQARSGRWRVELSIICQYTVHLAPTSRCPVIPRLKCSILHCIQTASLEIFSIWLWKLARHDGFIIRRIRQLCGSSPRLLVYVFTRYSAFARTRRRRTAGMIFPSPCSGRMNVSSPDGRRCASVWEIQPRSRLPSTRSAKKTIWPATVEFV